MHTEEVPQVPPDRRRVELMELRRLLDRPHEHLDVEIKGWLNLADDSDRANLAKAILAIANHGGGRVLLGWTERDGAWLPDEPRPQNLSMYSQDCINEIVAGYAEPVFHCDVDWLPASRDQLYPLVRVPGGHRVPIRSKRDGPQSKHVRINTYYIRRPGPASESPQNAREWDELIRRCLLAARTELLDDFRRVLQGPPDIRDLSTSAQPGMPSGIQGVKGSGIAALYGPLGQAVEDWHAESRGRWRSLVSEHLREESPSRYRFGTWSVAYGFGGYNQMPTLAELRNMLERAERHETGWPLWWVPTKEELKPYPVEGLIECWIRSAAYQDAAHSDFWRAAPRGLFFNVRGYAEDAYELLSPETGVIPGTIVDVTIPIWRVAEVLVHADHMAKQYSDVPINVAFRFRWEGLKNRRLGSLDWNRAKSVSPRISKQESVDSMIVMTSDSIMATLPESVQKLTLPLYEVFDFFNPAAPFVQTEVSNFLHSRTR